MGFGLMLFCITAVLLPFLTALVTIIVGRIRLARATKPVSYYPPRGYSPIDVWQKYYGFTAKAHPLINPIMLYWADRGFITIEEDCKRGLKLTKLKDLTLPDDIVELTDAQCKHFDAEEELFKRLFAGRKVFYTLAADDSYNKDIDKFISSCESSAKSYCKTRATKIIGSLCFALSIIFAVMNTIIVGLTEAGPACLMAIFPIVGMIMFRFVPNDGIAKFIRLPFFAVWGGAPLGVMLFILPPVCAVVMGCSAVLGAITLNVLYDRIDLRSPRDIRLYGEICAFKTFLLEAELDRLETLVEENPNYFYDILPYCYVLNITKKLKPKFDRITLDGPSWYLGDLRNTLMF